jgi:hypothetical protein
MSESVRPIVHPRGRTIHSSCHPSIYSNPRSIPSSSRTVFFLGGFVFVAAAVVVQTQHRDRDFLSGFVFVAVTAVAQTQHIEQPLIPFVIRPDCFFWVGLFLWCLANQLWMWISDYRRSSLGNKAGRSVGTRGVCFEYTTKRKG